MPQPNNPNTALLAATVKKLGPLADEFIFLGGCAVGLLITDQAAAPVRLTKDVDVITEVSSLVAYHALAERLRAQGFSEDIRDDAPICRWVSELIILDVMPTDSKILGFSNVWYKPAITAAQQIALDANTHIQLITAPYFLATKFEAFAGRGNGDYLLSHDIEDIVTLLDGRPELLSEIQASQKNLQQFLAAQCEQLLKSDQFMNALPGHIAPDAAHNARLTQVKQRIQGIVNVAKKLINE